MMTRCRLVFAVCLLPLAVLLSALVVLYNNALPESVSESQSQTKASRRPVRPSLIAGRASICFAPGTPREVIEAYYDAVYGDVPFQPFQHQDNQRWATTATNGGGLDQGDPTTITWSIVPDGTPIADGGVPGEEADPSDLRAFLTGLYGSPDVWMPLFQEVFDRWGDLTGTTYVFEPQDDGLPLQTNGVGGVRGDVRIGGHPLDGTSGVLAYNFFPPFGGDMVIDTNDLFYNNDANNFRAFRNVVSHEHGHGLGFAHVCPVSAGDPDPLVTFKLMEPFVNLAFDGPQPDDILAGHRGYGDPLEPNDSFFAPTLLGELESTTITMETLGLNVDNDEFLSIDDDSDTDWFAADMPANQFISVIVTPVGERYLEGPQDQACASGVEFDSRMEGDLVIEVIDINGSTRLITKNDTPAGMPEELIDFEMPPVPGTYFIRISNSGNSRAQMYEFELRGSVDDMEPPVVATVDPSEGSKSAVLTEILVTFDKPVKNVEPGDLTVNGSPATSAVVDGMPAAGLTQGRTGPFSFQGFESPPDGPVLVEIPDGALTDSFGNIFQGATWALEISDCNGNQFLDSEDVVTGLSDDCNGNTIPDECEADFVRADAGPDQTVTTSAIVTVGGSPAGLNGVPPYTYEWTLRGNPNGPIITESNPAYGPLPAGVYVARLVVTDSSGCSASDFVRVAVEAEDGTIDMPIPPVECAPAATMSSGLTLMAMIVATLSFRRRRRRGR